MRLTPGSPPPALLALTLAAFLPQLSSGATPFPQDLEPISIVGRECKFAVCVAMAIAVAGAHVRAEPRRYYLITGDRGLVRWMCLRACLQQVNLQRFIQLPGFFLIFWVSTCCSKPSKQKLPLIQSFIEWIWFHVSQSVSGGGSNPGRRVTRSQSSAHARNHFD